MDTTQVSKKQAILLNLRQQVSELYSLFGEEEQVKARKWSEEEPMLEAFISALTQTRELLRKEKKDITDQLAALRSKWEKEAAKFKKSDRTELTDESVEVDDLQKKLIDLNNRELDVKFELEKLKQQFEGALKDDERQIYETKLVVLQDTRRILLEEINLLRGEIFRRETSTKYESQCKTAESSGWEDLGRLEDQLARLEVKLDRAKQSMYFPEAKGYRFTGGSSGVYFAAKELYISELSGSFQLRCEPVQKSDGSWTVRLFVSLGGASNAQAADTPVALARIHRRSSSCDVRVPEPKVQAGNGPPTVAAASADAANLPTQAPCDSPPSSRSVLRHTPAKISVSFDAAHAHQSDDDIQLEGNSTPAFPPPLPSPSHSSADPNNDGSRNSRSHLANIMDSLGKNKATPSATPPGAASPAMDRRTHPLQLQKVQQPLPQPDLSAARGKFAGFARKMSQQVVARSQTLGERVAARGQTLGERVVATGQSLHDKVAARGHTLGEKMAPVVNKGQSFGERMGNSFGEKVGQALASKRGISNMNPLSRRSYSGDDPPIAPLSSSLSRTSTGGRSNITGSTDDSQSFDIPAGPAGAMMEDVDLLDTPDGSLHPITTPEHSPKSSRLSNSNRSVSGVSKSMSALPSGLAPEDTVSFSGRDDLSEVSSGLGASYSVNLGDTNQHQPNQLRTSISGLNPSDDLYERGNTTESGGVADLSDVLSTGERSDDGFETIPLSAVDQLGPVLTNGGESPTVMQRNSPVSSNNSGQVPPLTLGTASSGGKSEVATEGTETESERGDAAEKASMPGALPEEAQSGSRKGVHVTLLSESMEVVGEKGSKMPNISTKELALELEVTLQATFEYTGVGWQAVGTVVCEIVHLDRKVVGNNIPLPRTLIKTILNYLLPKALTKSFLTNLPVELGKYIMTSKDQWKFGGELRILGPSLPSFTVDLNTGSGAVPDAAKPTGMFTSVSTTAARTSQNAATLLQARRAMQLLGLTPGQVAALSELFMTRTMGLFMDQPRCVSVMELCRFYNLYHHSTVWHPLCNMVNRALQVIMDTNGTPDKDFVFLAFMEQHVSRLVKNPVRVNLAVQHLEFGVDVDAAVDTLRDLFERLARDFHKNAQRSQKHLIMREPLEVQLENLHKWHQSTQALTRAFKLRFKSASATLSASADKELFQINLNKLHYAGPLRMQVPVNLPQDTSGNSFVMELKLPRPHPAGKRHGLVGKIVQIVRDLADTVLTGVDQPESNGTFASEDMRAMIKDWQERLVEGGSPRTPRSDAATHFAGALEAPSLTDPVLGRVFIKRLHAGLQLDEKRISELLSEGIGSSNTNMVGSLLGCFGDLFSATVATQVQAEGAAEAQASKVMLTLQSNDVTVVRVDVDSLQFQSGISPKTATRLAHVLMVAIAHQFWALGSKRVRLMNRIFQHVHEYMSKDILDCVMSLSVSGQVKDNKMHVVFKGDPGRSAEASQQAGLQHPLHFVNDMNLGTVMESIKILVWDT